jgi:hypothetical protein
VRISSDLPLLGIDIQALAKESIVQTTKMKNLSTQMKTIEQQLNTYQAMRTEKLIKTKPEFSIKFHCSSVTAEAPHSSDIEANKIRETDTKIPSSMMNPLDLPHQGVAAQEFPTNQQGENNHFLYDYENSSISDDDDDNSYIQDNTIVTCYNVDRMASDGNNVLYTCYVDENPDLIAYCIMDTENYDADEYRHWNQSRIEDMIWWSRIGMFICATKDAIYTVDYINGRFKILCVIRGDYSHIRIAANTNNFFVHYTVDGEETNEIEVYTSNFELEKVIDVSNQKYLSTSSSFCVTDHILASICTRMQNNRQVFQVNFFDLDMNELSWVRLGGCNDSIEIRSDGKERFFISTGQQKLHIVSPNKRKKTINLTNTGDCIAVLDNRRIAVSYERKNIELVTY